MPGKGPDNTPQQQGFHLRARVLTCGDDASVQWLPDAWVSVDETGRLNALRPFREGDPFDEDVRAGVLTPGFVDGHVHYPQTRIVGRAAGPLLDWLRRVVFPEEARFSQREYAQVVASEFATALAAAGTTRSIIYGSVHAEAAQDLYAALASRGMRARLGPVLMDRGAPDELLVEAGRAIAELERLAASWSAPELELAVLPRFCLSCSPELMRAAADFADRHGLWVSTHLSENIAECEAVRREFASDYLSVYEDHGLLGARSVFAHCVHLSDRQWERIAASQAAVVHCPDSNDFLGSGTMPIGEPERLGVPLALGSDVAAGRSFSVPKVGAAAYDAARRSGATMDAARLFGLATVVGARALGFSETGRLFQGMQADMVLHDMPPHVHDSSGALDSIFFDGDRGPVLRTWVAGRRVR